MFARTIKMKTAVAFVIAFAVTFAGADHVDTYLVLVKEPMLACAKEYGFTEQTPREIFDKEVEMGVDKATCERACVMKSVGLMKDSKLVQENLDKFITTAHADEPDKIPALLKGAKECIDKVKPLTDECKMAYSFVECYLDKH